MRLFKDIAGSILALLIVWLFLVLSGCSTDKPHGTVRVKVENPGSDGYLYREYQGCFNSLSNGGIEIHNTDQSLNPVIVYPSGSYIRIEGNSCK
jgi:hypothetical protein